MSIKYIKPVYSKTESNKDLNDKHTNYAMEEDPWGYDNGTDVDNSNNFYGDQYRKAIYEQTEDRITSELIAYPYYVKTDEVTTGGSEALGTVLFTFNKTVNGSNATPIAFAKSGAAPAGTDPDETSLKFDGGRKVIKGYSVVYGQNEKDVYAVEETRGKNFVFDKSIIESVAYTATNEILVTFKTGATIPATLTAYARVDLEADFEGSSLGEVQLIPTDYEFRPRPTSIGVSWSTLSEITVESSYGFSIQDMLVEYAADAIRVNLDYRAFKWAYQLAKMNPAAYKVTFIASNVVDVANNQTAIDMDHYIHNAQTVVSAIDTLSDSMLNEIDLLVS